MKAINLYEDLNNNEYPGRGIVIGKSSNGENAVIAYFIMGRSENSRNRVFETDKMGINTKAFDPSKLVDPSLIIYSPVRVLENETIVTNGDQTDTIYDAIKDGKSFEYALGTRTFEPDPPNFTPRISAIVTKTDGDFSYKMSILKSDNNRDDATLRFFYEYESPISGEGHFIHTYRCDGDPIPSFEGEPKTVTMEDDIDVFAQKVWGNLNEQNKVSLLVRYISLKMDEVQTRIINKNK